MAGGVDEDSGDDESSGDDAEDDTRDDLIDDEDSELGLDVGDEPPTVIFLIVSPLTVKLYS